MLLETMILSTLTKPDADSGALVLMGSGARTAYQAGVLHALSTMLTLEGVASGTRFPSRSSSALRLVR